MSKNLQIAERTYIAESLKKGMGKTAIAKDLGVSASTIYREVARNARKSGLYDPIYAQKIATARKKRVGSIPKRKAVQKRKKPYILYADRRYIFWFSDEYYKRKVLNSFHSPLGNIYRCRLCKKKFHYYLDAPLFLLLYLHEGWTFPTTVDILYKHCLPKNLPLFYTTPQKWMESLLPSPTYLAVA